MKKLLLLIITLLLLPGICFSLPAFPGAEGMGAATIGGRDASATVYIVDQLGDNAAAEAAGTTLREALEASGSRYIVFAVSGIIDLEENITVFNPYFTLAGQTSPSGITIVGGEIQVYTHDAIITHMRFRSGEYRCDAETDEGDERRSFEVTGCGYMVNPACSNADDIQAYNVMIDHCSFSWGPDNVTGVNGNGQDVTFSWCYITYGSQNGCHSESDHNLGFFVWGAKAGGTPVTESAKVSLHHSLMLGNRFRIPENNYNSFLDSVNNVILDGDGGYTHFLQTTNATANIIGTYRLPGYGINQIDRRSAAVQDYDTATPNNQIYMYGCLDDYRTSQEAAQWSAQEYWHGDQSLSTDWQKETAWATTGYSGNGIAVTATAMDSTYADYIAANAGATKCQSGDCRDGVDVLALADYTRGYGRYIDSTDVDTLVKVTAIIDYGSPAESPTDSDSDGMSDAWEMSTFGDLDQTATTDFDGDGYNDLEEYLHYLAGYDVGGASTITTNASGTFTIK